LTAGLFYPNIVPVTQRSDDEKFLRAAIKTGLRLQSKDVSGTERSSKSDGVATLQRIKTSLRNRKKTSKSNP
jgi:hypothetical protein